jgi:hypothetical protein
MTEKMRVDDNDPQRLPLHGIRVLDLTRAAARCPCHLAARRPRCRRNQAGGPATRRLPAAVTATSERRQCCIHCAESRQAQRVYRLPQPTLRLSRFTRCCPADVFVESAIPGSLHKYGLDFPALTQRNPRLVYCSISGFGQDGTPLFYLMVATRSGVIAASWGAQLDQPWSPFKGKSKCPFEPPRLRYCA